MAHLSLGLQQGGKVKLAVLIRGQGGLEGQLGLRQQTALGQLLGTLCRVQPTQVFRHIRPQLVAHRFTPFLCRIEHGLGLTLLCAASALLQRDVELQHHAPFADAALHLGGRDGQCEVRVAVLAGQLARQLSRLDAGLL